MISIAPKWCQRFVVMLTVELHLHCVVKKPLNHYGLLIRESCNRCVENDDDGSEIQTLNVLSLQTQRSH